MRMIEELFYGNVTPNERPIKRGSKMEHLAHLMAKNNDAMRDMLKDETLLAQFEKCCGSQNDLAARMEIDAFTEGFCIAECFLTEVIAWLAAQENSD